MVKEMFVVGAILVLGVGGIVFINNSNILVENKLEDKTDVDDLPIIDSSPEIIPIEEIPEAQVNNETPKTNAITDKKIKENKVTNSNSTVETVKPTEKVESKKVENNIPKQENNTNSIYSESTKQEEKSDNTEMETKEDLSKVIDPNSWLYSFHGNTIHFSTEKKCLDAGKEIALSNTVDINYFRCLEVQSKAQTIMGYYLNIFCESGNCEKYVTAKILNDYK